LGRTFVAFFQLVLDVTLIGPSAIAYVGALTTNVINKQPRSSDVSLAQVFDDTLLLNRFRNFPQLRQNVSLLFRAFLHSRHGLASRGFGRIFIFKVFSAIRRVRVIPVRISSKPAARWKTAIAISSPNKYPMETMVVMRIMFKNSNIIRPVMNSNILLLFEALMIVIRNVENIVKAISVYIPEQGRSMVKADGSSVDRDVTIIVGGPYLDDRVTGVPRVFSMV